MIFLLNCNKKVQAKKGNSNVTVKIQYKKKINLLLKIILFKEKSLQLVKDEFLLKDEIWKALQH